jgi:hypothetical protein
VPRPSIRKAEVELIDSTILCEGIKVQLYLSVSAKDFETLTPAKTKAILTGITMLLSALELKGANKHGDKAVNA